jgi:hypothetical protein
MKTLLRKLAVASCAALLLASALAVQAQSLPPEVQVGTRVVNDFEFDWGRDGTFCATCNYGAGNNRLTYIDQQGNVWVSHIDVTTGNFVPGNGKETLVDTNAVPAQAIGNGSEWVGLPSASALVYTRKNESVPGDTCVGLAKVNSSGAWSGGCVPATGGGKLPLGTAIVGDAYPMMSFQDQSDSGGTSIYWQLLSWQSTPQLVLDDNGTLQSRRWIPGTHAMLLAASAPPDQSGNVYQQIFLYSTDDGSLQQLTFDPSSKNSAFMWQAPEVNNTYVFLAVRANGKEIDIYRYLPDGSGASSWRVTKRIQSTPDYPYIISPEPFVYQGRSWVFFEVDAAQRQRGSYAAGQIAISGIQTGISTFRMLTADTGPDIHTRRDPEYYITANGPYIYYNRAVLSDGTPTSEGVFRVDTGLGAPESAAVRAPVANGSR